MRLLSMPRTTPRFRTHVPLLFVLLSLPVSGGCGDGIGDGQWRTVFFDDFNYSDGDFTPSELLFVERVASDEIAISSERLQYQAGSTDMPALYYESSLSGLGARLTF